MKVSAIILAAGMSTRFGKKNKLLHKIEGEPMIVKTVRQIVNADVNEVIVVTGSDSDEIKTKLNFSRKIKTIFNPEYRRGMSTSIKIGINSIGLDADACIICLGDMPYLTTEDYSTQIDAWKHWEDNEAILVPAHNEESGHPVIFGSAYFEDLKNLPVSDKGAKILLDKYDKFLREISVDHDRIFLDVDFLEDKWEAE